MPTDVLYGKTLRKSFARTKEIMDMPNLLEIQKSSYKWFLETGLREVFKETDAVTDYSGNLELSFIDYSMDEKPKYTEEECKARDATYAAPLKVRVRLRNKETDEIKEQVIFMGDFPIMTPGGTFVINGAERVIVSQIVRSPGVYFDKTTDKTMLSIYASTVIPYHGAWLEYETDTNDVFNVRIDKNRKLPITWFLKAMGQYDENSPARWLSCIDDTAVGAVTNERLKEIFGEDERIIATLDKDTTQSRDECLIEIYRRLRPGDPPTVESAETLLDGLFFDHRRYDISDVGRYKFNKKLSLFPRIAGFELAAPVADPYTGELLADAGETISRDKARQIDEAGVVSVVLNIGGKNVKVFSNGMVDMKRFVDFDPAEVGVKGKVRGIILRQLLEQFEGEALKDAIRQNIDLLVPKHIIVDDMFSSVNYLNALAHGVGNADDIDHLGNRRVRCVGELLQNQFRIGFSRMERVIRERMTLQDLDIVTPQSLINIRPVTAAIKEFFGSSPLSQFMDQTNPLAELTHKRRMSALGPGGLSRERASFDVRDVHYSHYGRLCPIETPEGPNIGLISYLASYARANEYGFLVAPYRKVEKGTCRVTDEVEYMTADVEDQYIVAQASEPVDENGCLLNRRVTCRHRNDTIEVNREEVDYVDVSPKMMISIATAMIPFLENDDANRALMGANMQRQAVPLMTTQAPIVATGIEHKCAVDSGVCVLAEGDGTVTRVDANYVTVRYDAGESKDYKLIKFARSNQGTCINQHPIVKEGEVVEIDPRTDLVAKLIEYKKYKDLAEILREAASEAALVYDKPQEDISQYTDNPDEYLSLSLDKFVTAFEEFLQREKRLADVKAHYQRVEREKATIESRIGFIRNKLRNVISQGLKKLSIRELIPNKKDKYDVIVTFVSVLQMMKDRLLDAEQKRNYADILVKPFRATPIADDPDDGLINAGEPNDPAPSRYKRIADETEARINIVERSRKRKDADMTIVQRAKEIDKASASVTAIIDAYEKEKREAEEAAKAAEAAETETAATAETETAEAAASEEVVNQEESAEKSTEENIDGGQQES